MKGGNGVFVFLALALTSLLLTVHAQECVEGEIDPVRSELQNDDRWFIRYCLDGEWTRLCANSLNVWNTVVTRVVCRQLGYSNILDKGLACPSTDILETRQVTLPNGCSGNENRLDECKTGVSPTSCFCTMHGWVICLPACTDGDVRLMGGASDREGRVEVCVDGRWGTVCGEGWTNEDAGHVCTRLGYPTEGARMEFFTPGFTSIHNCTINATNLSCAPLTDASCNHTLDIGVVCTSFEEAYNTARVAFEQLQEMCSTTTESTTTSPLSTVSTPSLIVECSTTVYEVFVGVLVTVIIAMTIGWITTCILMRTKLSKNNGSDSLQIINPRYVEATTPQLRNPQAETETINPRSSTNERESPSVIQSAQGSTKQHATNRSRHGSLNIGEDGNFENSDYAMVNLDNPEEPSYSVIDRKVGVSREGGYDTLIRSGDHETKRAFDIITRSDSHESRRSSYSTLVRSEEYEGKRSSYDTLAISEEQDNRRNSYDTLVRSPEHDSRKGYDTLARSGEHDSKLEFSTSLERERSYSKLLSSYEAN